VSREVGLELDEELGEEVAVDAGGVGENLIHGIEHLPAIRQLLRRLRADVGSQGDCEFVDLGRNVPGMFGEARSVTVWGARHVDEL
jgi:hypothetical protein